MQKILSFFIVLLSFRAFATDDPLVISSSLKSVTVYRSGAEMIHNSSVQLSQGNQDLVIEGISNAVDINSIQINCPAAVTIMGVEFVNNYLVAPESSARIKLLQDSADRTQKEIEKINSQMQTTNDLLGVLKLNREVKGQQTGLSVAELMKLMDYYKIKSAELQNELASEKERLKKFSEVLTRINNQIGEEQARNTHQAGRLHLQLSVAASGKYDFIISYITPNAWWTPYYDIRVDDIKSPLKVIYKAKLAQTTGIDWKKVKLSLSTSLPSQWGNAPVLKSWFLAYINPISLMERDLKKNNIQPFDQPPGSMNETIVTGYGRGQTPKIKIRGAMFLGPGQKPMYIVNGAIMSEEDIDRIDPSSVKSVNVLTAANASSLYGSRGANGAVVVTLKEGLEDYVSVTDNELNMIFDIDLPYDISTTGKEQTATLREYSVGALYKYYSVPRLDKDAYLLAEVADWEKLNLLPGEANIIFEGTYVGKSFIDPASTADTLNLTLGRDKRMVVKKEKLMDYSSVKFLGSNKLQKITYEITVKNNKKDSVRMMLKDQYPLSTNKEIEVELINDGGAVNNPETGVLTWKLELAPGEMKKIRFAYSVKYPKDKLLNLN